ncbi:prepilin peptidase CpaA [Natranaerovirga pectinivora]|uniref:Prepilin peptidase CpaA n=1 Tax=Natranaerovirga pectinivora TaxID=682400 RepID=A0A4R3MIU4_9FIRM|nr:prepilin peptidase [Natranaerovirga pectinivora]TCT11655.1 prepilin peptidase CpaA [Natranaerovirga pectinivora]
MTIAYINLIIILIISVITDKKSYKINNKILFIGSLFGFFLNSVQNGLKGFTDSFLGFILPITFLFVLFALNMLGAGDVKLFATIGALMGFEFVLYVMLYSFVFGGILAFVILIRRRLLLNRLKYFMTYITSVFITKRLGVYYDKKRDGLEPVMHFSYAITMGVLIKIITLM